MARRIRAALAVAAGALVLAPAASASITPTLTLNQTAAGGTEAGATVPLGTDIKFAPSLGDSPKDLTLILPAGLLADASIDNGACLMSKTPIAACQVGSGTATAALFNLFPVPLPVSFDLVAPPKAGDLAGLALVFDGSELGTPGDITVRSSTDPAGVGLDIAFTGIPNSVLVPISIQELNTTFSGLRLPASCPATPANVTVRADSYSDPTQRTAGAPLQVVDCAKLAYSPAFRVTATRDSGDVGAQITSDITQPASPAQATSRTVRLTLPPAVLAPNVAAVLSGGILCADPGSGTCKTIGTASATSPLYPTPLTGKDYLTGSLAAPAIEIVFPPPFALTLSGTVDLSTNATTFTGVPDIPLTDLQVSLAGGPDSAFEASCSPAAGTATSTLTSQNGDQTAVASSSFTVSGCPAATQPLGTPPPPSKPRIASASLSGLQRGRPALSFKLVAGTNGPNLRMFAIGLPAGLSFRHKGHKVSGVSFKGVTAASVVLKRGRLVVTLRRSVASVIVKLSARALTESARLEHRAKIHHVKSLKLTIVIQQSAHTSTTVTFQITNLHL